MDDFAPYDTRDRELQILELIDALPDDAYERVRECLEKRPSKRGAPTIIPPEDAARFKLCLRLRREFIKSQKLIETPRASMLVVAVYCKIDTDDSRTLARLIHIAGFSEPGIKRSGDTAVNRRATKMERERTPEARAQLLKQIAALEPYKRR